MPTITIDGKTYEVGEGRTILQAMDDLGLLMNEVQIPHYCWHPKLSIDGSCRLCQVEVEGIPKLQIACNTPVRDGMVVLTKTDRVKTVRQGVLELLLVNHPLDCPICDQAGECTLQDYSFAFGRSDARTQEPRRPARKRTELGPTIVFDQERCILCRRCVRFCREIAGTGELGVFSRGEDSVLELFPGSRLDNPYSMCVADVCPVGALTTRDFRFKIRVWFLDDVESLCDQCANGCNIWASRSNNRIYRNLPRRNDSVNDTWMCDHGRLSYKRIHDNRIDSPAAAGCQVSYGEALDKAASAIRAARQSGGRILGFASPFASNEDLFILRRLLAALDAPPATFVVPRGEPDDLLIKAEKAPNANGARALGFLELSDPPGAAAVAIVLGHGPAVEMLESVDSVMLLDTHASELASRADVVFPTRVCAEKEGTFTNHANRVQRFRRVVEPPFEAYAEAEILQQLAVRAGLDGFVEKYDVGEISQRLSETLPAFAGIGLDTLDDLGRELD